MKYILIFDILIVCFLGCKEDSIVNAQDNSSENEITIFFKAVDDFDSFFNDSLGWRKEFTENEIMEVSKKWYNAIYKKPVKYDLYFHNLHDVWEEKVKIEREKYLHKRPGLQLGRLSRKITEYTNVAFSELLRVPYLFRIRVKKFETSNYYSEDLKGNLRQTDMIVEIEDIIKGREYFSIGDSLKVSFFGHWFHGATEEQYFKVDSTYFLPVNLFRIENEYTFQYKIQMLSDYNFAVYPIIDEVVKTPKDYFGIGETSNWKDFKSFIKENYAIQ